MKPYKYLVAKFVGSTLVGGQLCTMWSETYEWAQEDKRNWQTLSDHKIKWNSAKKNTYTYTGTVTDASVRYELREISRLMPMESRTMLTPLQALAEGKRLDAVLAAQAAKTAKVVKASYGRFGFKRIN